MKTEDKIMSYLDEQEEIIVGGIDQLQYIEDDELLEKMVKFVNSLDSNKLPDLQAEELELIKYELDDED